MRLRNHPSQLISMSLLSCWWLCGHLLPCTFLALIIHSFHTITRKKLWKWFVSNQRYIILTLWPCKTQSIHIPHVMSQWTIKSSRKYQSILGLHIFNIKRVTLKSSCQSTIIILGWLGCRNGNGLPYKKSISARQDQNVVWWCAVLHIYT